MREAFITLAREWIRSDRWGLQLFWMLGGVAGALFAVIILYFGYDYASARSSPCESIFRQTAHALSTKISFLKAHGEVQIGREPLIELGERAQMTALNLKTCCIVLSAGSLDPEQFLQCKAKARHYEARVENILTVVRNAGPVEPAGTGGAGAGAGEPPTATGSAVPTGNVTAQIETDLEAARAISRAFNAEVVEVRKAQALESLEIVPPRHVDVSAAESEPNNDTLNTNLIEVGKWITASIGSGTDLDFYSFTTPAEHRDWISIELENRSTTLEPRIWLFDAKKTSIGSRDNTTPGADLTYQFVSAPSTRYVFRTSNYYGKSVGAYLVRVVASKSYDSFEPNDTILSARTISAGKTVAARIMDGLDYDFFRLEIGEAAKQIEIKIANLSTTLRPHLVVFDGNKTNIGGRENTTAGGELSHTVQVTPGAAIYLRVSDYYAKAAGAYEITVRVKN